MYSMSLEDGDYIFTVEQFMDMVADKKVVDIEGYAYAVKDGLFDPSVQIKPSTILQTLPHDATDILWVET